MPQPPTYNNGPSDHTNPIDRQRPAGRYQAAGKTAAKSQLSSKLLAVGLVAIVVLAVIFGARYMANRSAVPVSAQMGEFETIDDNHIGMYVDVLRDDVSQPSYCIVKALDYNMAEVGRREILIPAGGPEAQRLWTVIPTRAYPVSVGVYGCATDIPHHMDLQ
ncbi:putative secreted protein [Corynebacterium renale]|uniref:Uncharacterized protein DUF4307 n=1 Tax=Corynebacterium renale TaxID=1724 RepID=A0A2A9DQQ8_9CORY|nr:DUF4307 domain-containing protein [Corynebacterium renale]PFG29028.1 uncharacterized protein DUF4307 [Corynebacterium renale]SQG64377.1 putative secreted protein [Corynebacterium renale]SQI25305.1 putative secreted protein [Corynebacterium renale]STC95097.1 putative secreted protein [Corynebacterium renale]